MSISTFKKKSISSLLIENKIIVIHIASIVQFYFAFSNSPGSERTNKLILYLGKWISGFFIIAL
ncbi:hypothetical protein EFY79_17810 [Hanamia caeni]|jgi:hypothetical protein|uniref:Uncharacterized protein n=1 Tax=Hanamia caeni TaxID=2294116 RepID=A0A3M9N7P9_9BACT|nr:hypothetical protein EFY79_17810 [Hanamia caeni]